MTKKFFKAANAKKNTVGALKHCRTTCASLRYVSLAKIRTMNSTQGIEVDTAVLCSRLQVLRFAGSAELAELRRELESELYPIAKENIIASRRFVGKRLGMTAEEVIGLFGSAKPLSPLAFKVKNMHCKTSCKKVSRASTRKPIN